MSTRCCTGPVMWLWAAEVRKIRLTLGIHHNTIQEKPLAAVKDEDHETAE